MVDEQILKKILIDIEVQLDQANNAKKITELSDSVKNLKKAKEEQNKTNNFTIEAENALSQQLKKTKNELDANVRAALSSKGSLEELRNRVNLLRREFERAPLGGDRFKQLQKEIADTQKKIIEIDKSTYNFKTGVGGYAQDIVSAFSKVTMAIGAASGVIAFFKESIEAYDKQIASEQSLAVALGKTSQALLDQAQALQQITRYRDQEIIQGQAFLAQLGATEEEIKKLTPVILDFAAAKQKPLMESFDSIAKAIYSSENALSKQGIVLTGAAGSTYRLNEAIEKLNNSFGGTAKVLGEVGAGPLTVLKNNLLDILEIIGSFIAKGINPFVTALKDFAVGIKEIITGTVSLENVLKTFVSFFSLIAGPFSVVDKITKSIVTNFAGLNKETKELSEITQNSTGKLIDEVVVIAKKATTLKKLNEDLHNLQETLQLVPKGSEKYLETADAINKINKEIKEFEKAGTAAHTLQNLNIQLQLLNDELQKTPGKSKRFHEIILEIRQVNAEIESFEKVSYGASKKEADKFADAMRLAHAKFLIIYNDWKKMLADAEETRKKQFLKDLKFKIPESDVDTLANAKALEIEHEINLKEAANLKMNGLSNEYFDREKEIILLHQEYVLATENLTASQRILLHEQTAAAIAETEQKQYELQKERIAQTIGAAQNAFTALYQMSGNQEAFASFAKAMAIANIAINTGLAISEGIKASAGSVPFPVNLSAIAATIAVVLTNMATAVQIASSAAIPPAPALKSLSSLGYNKTSSDGSSGGSGGGSGGQSGKGMYTGGVVVGADGIDKVHTRLTAGEAVINKTSTAMFAPLLSRINEIGGGVSFADSMLTRKRNFFTGGVVTSGIVNSINSSINVTSELSRIFSLMPAPVVFVEDINLGQQRVTKVQSRANF